MPSHKLSVLNSRGTKSNTFITDEWWRSNREKHLCWAHHFVSFKQEMSDVLRAFRVINSKGLKIESVDKFCRFFCSSIPVSSCMCMSSNIYRRIHTKCFIMLIRLFLFSTLRNCWKVYFLLQLANRQHPYKFFNYA